MPMLDVIILVAAASVGTAEPKPSPSASAAFRMVGTEFLVPLPDGYCIPTGEDVDVAQLMAAGDPDNVTHLTLYPCVKEENDGGAGNYVLIKTPRESVAGRISRPELLNAIGAEFESEDFKAMMASQGFLKEAGNDLGKVVGTKVDLGGAIRPLGKDDFCAYMGGVVKVGMGGQAYDQAAGGCISAVGERVLTVFWYGKDTTDAGVGSLLSKSRKLMESVQVKAGK
jgi:hypothetical protein